MDLENGDGSWRLQKMKLFLNWFFNYNQASVAVSYSAIGWRY